MKLTTIITLVVWILVSSCNNDRPVLKTIVVNYESKIQSINFEDHFDSCKVISLETNKESLIGQISRISLFKSRIYILDVVTNCVLIYDSTGKFLNKIHSPGTEVGNFIALRDFAIDESNERLIVHSHRPYKLLYYDLGGRFLSEKRIKSFYHNIGNVGDHLVSVNLKQKNGYMVNISDQGFENLEGFVKPTDQTDLFESLTTIFPNMLKSKKTYITFPFTSTIYTYRDHKVTPIYNIDFKKNNLPDSLFDKKLSAREIYDFGSKNNLGFFISNFRETKNYFFFSFGKANMVLISKKTGKSTTFNFVRNKKDLISFGNYFGHDGDDEYVISIKEAEHFKRQMDIFKNKPELWSRLSEDIKTINDNLTVTSNPLLIIYKLK